MEKNTLNLKCQICGCDYEKPLIYKKHLVSTNFNVFYLWSLAYCDDCRRRKEKEVLKALPDIFRALGKA